MKLNIILDSRIIERYAPLISELKRQKISDFELWPCLMLPDVVSSINASHRMIVQDAMDKGLKEVAIAEDDIYFPSPKGWEWFLKNKPPIFDIYAGGSYHPLEREYKEGAMRASTIIGFHCYVVSSRYYETFLQTPPELHIDAAQKSNLMYVCYPMPALQRAGFSSNNKAVCNYNAVLSQKDIYQ